MKMDFNIYKYRGIMAQGQRFVSRMLCLYIGKVFAPNSAHTTRHAFDPYVYTTKYPTIPAAIGHKSNAAITFAAPVNRGKTDVVLEE